MDFTPYEIKRLVVASHNDDVEVKCAQGPALLQCVARKIIGVLGIILPYGFYFVPICIAKHVLSPRDLQYFGHTNAKGLRNGRKVSRIKCSRQLADQNAIKVRWARQMGMMFMYEYRLS